MKNALIFISFVFLSCSLFAQEEKWTSKDHISSHRGESFFGVGIGLNYGGFGCQYGRNILKGTNVWAGLGFQYVRLGYNVGVIQDFPSNDRVQGFISAMYGTNATIFVEDNNDFSAIFRGFSFGTGLKLNSKRRQGSYASFSIIYPLRSDEFYDSVEFYESNPSYQTFNEPFPITLAFGYHVNLGRSK